MKRIIKLSIILLVVMIACSGIVYAAPSCNISLETTSSEFNKNDTFSVNVKMSNIVSEKGMIALEAVLEYDKESLTLLKMEGQNEWSNPVKDLSYNEGTGKLVIDKDGLAKSDEVILKLTFKVNENSKKMLMDFVIIIFKSINNITKEEIKQFLDGKIKIPKLRLKERK